MTPTERTRIELPRSLGRSRGSEIGLTVARLVGHFWWTSPGLKLDQLAYCIRNGRAGGGTLLHLVEKLTGEKP